jgi:hypothetical protein
MTSVKRDLDHLKEKPSSLLDTIARVIGWSTPPLDRPEILTELLESYWSQYDRRSSPGIIRPECRLIHILDEISKQVEPWFRYPFHPSTLRVRCWLWVYSEALTLEVRALSVCATTMRSLARNDFDERGPKSTPTRVVFDTVGDPLAFLFTPKPPSPVLGVVFHLLRDCQEICLTYTLDRGS